jgi:hypothetical protein
MCQIKNNQNGIFLIYIYKERVYKIGVGWAFLGSLRPRILGWHWLAMCHDSEVRLRV